MIVLDVHGQALGLAFILFLRFFIPIFVVVFLIIYFSNKKKAKEKAKYRQELDYENTPYFRDIPFDDLETSFWIGMRYGLVDDIGNFIGAVLLKWIKEDKIDIKEIEGKTVIDMNKLFKTDIGFETKIYVMLLGASGTNRLLEEAELVNMFRVNQQEVAKAFKDLESTVKKDLLKKGILVERQNECGTFSIDETSLSKAGAKKMLGLKKFLCDFSNIENREAIEVHLWEDYMIYAQLFGIADKVGQEFERIYPGYSDIMKINTAKIAFAVSASLALKATFTAIMVAALRTNTD